MEIVKMSNDSIVYPSREELENMTNYELYELANLQPKFRKVLIKYILSFEVKPVKVIYDEDGNYSLRKIGLSEQLKNILLRHDFEYLVDLTYVTSTDLFNMKYFGPKRYNELIHVMSMYGLQLADKK